MKNQSDHIYYNWHEPVIGNDNFESFIPEKSELLPQKERVDSLPDVIEALRVAISLLEKYSNQKAS